MEARAHGGMHAGRVGDGWRSAATPSRLPPCAPVHQKPASRKDWVQARRSAGVRTWRTLSYTRRATPQVASAGCGTSLPRSKHVGVSPAGLVGRVVELVVHLMEARSSVSRQGARPWQSPHRRPCQGRSTSRPSPSPSSPPPWRNVDAGLVWILYGTNTETSW